MQRNVRYFSLRFINYLDYFLIFKDFSYICFITFYIYFITAHVSDFSKISQKSIWHEYAPYLLLSGPQAQH